MHGVRTAPVIPRAGATAKSPAASEAMAITTTAVFRVMEILPLSSQAA
jgi:hypothetical protein